MNRATSKRRLLALAGHLDTVPRHRFDFSRVCSRDATHGSCGSSGCAMGHAPSVPILRRAGLTIAPPSLEYGSYLRINGGEEAVDFIAAAQWLFGISFSQAMFLFAPSERGCPGLPATATPKRVAKHIRKFVEEEL